MKRPSVKMLRRLLKRSGVDPKKYNEHFEDYKEGGESFIPSDIVKLAIELYKFKIKGHKFLYEFDDRIDITKSKRRRYWRRLRKSDSEGVWRNRRIRTLRRNVNRISKSVGYITQKSEVELSKCGTRCKLKKGATLSQKIQERYGKRLCVEYGFFDDRRIKNFSDQPSIYGSTCFLINRNTIVTASHSITLKDWDEGQECERDGKELKEFLDDSIVLFGYQIDGFDSQKQGLKLFIHRVKSFFGLNRTSGKAKKEFTKGVDFFEIDSLVHASDVLIEKSDYAVLKLHEKVPGPGDIVPISQEDLADDKTLGRLFCRCNDPTDYIGEDLYTIGHPLGLPKKLVPNGKVSGRKFKDQYQTTLDTFMGNSGSPVFNDEHKLVGLFVSGYPDFIVDKCCIRHSGTSKNEKIKPSEAFQSLSTFKQLVLNEMKTSS